MGNGWERARVRRAGIRDIVNAIKEYYPCVDCGERHPFYAMDFDHVRGEKKIKMGNKVGGHGLGKVLEEIDKCDIVCSNCHRARTWKRAQLRKKHG